MPRPREVPDPPSKSGRLRDWPLQWFTVAGLDRGHDIEPEIARAVSGPSTKESRILVKATHSGAARIIENLRTSLGVPPLAAVSLIELLSKALVEGGKWSNILIHTTYFNHEAVLWRIRHAIRPQGAEAVARPESLGRRGSLEHAARVDWPPRGFAWWLLRWCIRTLVIFSPVLLLYGADIAILYPQLRDAQVRWASAPRSALVS